MNVYSLSMMVPLHLILITHLDSAHFIMQKYIFLPSCDEAAAREQPQDLIPVPLDCIRAVERINTGPWKWTLAAVESLTPRASPRWQFLGCAHGVLVRINWGLVDLATT